MVSTGYRPIIERSPPSAIGADTTDGRQVEPVLPPSGGRTYCSRPVTMQSPMFVLRLMEENAASAVVEVGGPDRRRVAARWLSAQPAQSPGASGVGSGWSPRSYAVRDHRCQ